jgi:hypothetical protein
VQQRLEEMLRLALGFALLGVQAFKSVNDLKLTSPFPI